MSYTVGSADAGFTLRSAVTAVNSAGASTALSFPTSLVMASGGTSSITLLQSNAVRATAVGSVSASFFANNQPGNLIIAVVRMSTTWQTVNVNDSAGNVYVDAVTQAQSTDGHQLHLFYAKNISGGANIVTATFSSTNNHPWLAIYEYTGLSATNPLDQTAHAQGSSAAVDTGMTSATSSVSELVFAATGLPASYSGTVNAGSGYMLQQQDTGSSRAATEAAIVNSSGSFDGIFNLNAAPNWSAVVATFKAAGSSGGGTPPPPLTLMQSNAARGSGVGSLSASFPSSNHAGNLIIVVARMSTASQTVSMADTAGNVYAEAVSQVQTSDGHQVHLFYAKNIAGAANTVTATFSSTNNHPWLAIFEFSGLSIANPLDQTARAQGSGTAADTGPTAITNSANELVFAAVGLPASYTGVVSAGVGYALQQQDTGSSRAAAELMNAISTGSFDGTFSLNSATSWSAVVATFRP